jgi:hypothetical protein
MFFSESKQQYLGFCIVTIEVIRQDMAYFLKQNNHRIFVTYFEQG